MSINDLRGFSPYSIARLCQAFLNKKKIKYMQKKLLKSNLLQYTLPMSNTTKYYVIVAQSSINFGDLYLGYGKSKSEAWDDATGGGRRNRDWDCRECDSEFYFSEGLAGGLI